MNAMADPAFHFDYFCSHHSHNCMAHHVVAFTANRLDNTTHSVRVHVFSQKQKVLRITAYSASFVLASAETEKNYGTSPSKKEAQYNCFILLK